MEFLGVFTTKFAALQERPSYYDYPIRILTRHLGSMTLQDLGAEEIETFRAARLAEVDGGAFPVTPPSGAIIKDVTGNS